MGLGNKAGKGLPLFNESLRSGQTTFRLVLVKRPVGARGERGGERGGGRGGGVKKQLSDEGKRLLIESMDG